MNDLSFPAPEQPKRQVYFTAGELAKLGARWGVKKFQAERSVRRHAEKNGWNDLPEKDCRKRGKLGGGFEYNISLIPELETKLLREWMMSSSASARKVAVVKAPTAPAVVDERVKKIDGGVDTARAAIILAITRYAALPDKGLKISGAINAFLKAQDAHQFWIDAHDANARGEVLTSAQLVAIQRESPLTAKAGFALTMEVLEKANDRPRKGGDFVRIGRSTIWAWLKKYNENRVEGLAPVKTKVEDPILDEFWRFMRYYAMPTKPVIVRAHKKYLENTAAGIQPLSLDQVKYTLRRKLDHIEKNKGREGVLTLRSRMAHISRDTSNMLPTEIYVADGHTFDAEVADPDSRKAMRPEITAIMDVATRKLVGHAISRKENTIAVTEGLRNACVNHGIPAIFYTDRGAGYKNKIFDDDGVGLMGRLGIEKVHALPCGSQAKGNIERSHQTLWITLARDFETYIGADMDKEASNKAFKLSRKDIEEFGQSRLHKRWNTFRDMVARRVEEYNNEPHSSLPFIEDPVTGKRRNLTPNEAWQMHVNDGFEPVLVDPDYVDDFFRPYVERTVSRCLLNWNTNEYFSADLNPYHQQKVFLGYDDAQSDKVWVREIDRQTGEPGRLICVAVYAGNKVDYMPRTRIAAAVERRQKSALKRIDRKREDKIAEANAPLLLEHEVAPITAEIFDLRDTVTAAAAAKDITPTPVADNVKNIEDAPAAQPRRRVFRSDEELAAWAIEHPGELSANQIGVLMHCMKDSTARKLLEMAGVDTEALRNLLRAVA